MDVLQLPDDIMLEIFFLNTNIFLEENCLQTTTSCSQVCISWRSLLLSTSSIWGRLLHIDELLRTTDTWRMQILARTGNSLLWVSGLFMTSRTKRRFILESILSANWERIEHLKLTVENPKAVEFWPILQRSAPNLRSFYFMGGIWKMKTWGPETALFSDHAPLLHVFSAECLPLNIFAAWLKNLRRLTLARNFTIFDILTCLQSASLLEFLHLDTFTLFNALSEPVTLPIVVLPKLSRIWLSGSEISDCMTLLRNIQFTERCGIILDPDSDSTETLENFLKEALPSLSAYLKRYVHAHRFEIGEIEVQLVADEFSFKCRNQDSEKDSDTDRVDFRLAIRTYDRAFSDGVRSMLPALFSTCDFSSIPTLTLNVLPISTAPVSTYLPYFCSFPSVTALATYESTLRTLLMIYESSTLDTSIFPLLRTLTIRAAEVVWVLPEPLPTDIITKFLQHRRSIGFPIQELICYGGEFPSQI